MNLYVPQLFYGTFLMEVFGPSLEMFRAFSTALEVEGLKGIILDANSTGWWYIKVEYKGRISRIYTLNLTLLPSERTEYDDNDSFETADEIELGSLKAYRIGNHDRIDYYKIWLDQGQVVQVELYPMSRFFDQDINMYVYSPNHGYVNGVAHWGHEPLRIIFTTDSTGWWYIEIVNFGWKRICLINIVLLPSDH